MSLCLAVLNLHPKLFYFHVNCHARARNKPSGIFSYVWSWPHVWLVDCGTQCVRRVRTWGSLAWRKAQVSKCCLKLPEGQYRDAPDSSQKSTTTRSRGNGHKLQQGVLDERKNKYHHEGVQTLGRVPREAVETVFGNTQNRTGHSHEQDNF